MQAMRRVLGVQSSSDFHDHGLRLLVPDPSDIDEVQARRTIDIVFIHGLTGTWDGTWTGATSDGQKVLWPKELLKERFPTARIFSFSYDANAVNLAHRVSTQSITQHANDLLIELETVRRETRTQEYKIVFTVHSLGGLVVQKMLSLSKTSHEPHYQRIESFTIGAVFFGTPMLGADLGAWASIGTALSSVLKQTNRDIVGVLEPNSAMAESIRLDFTNLVVGRSHTSNPIKIACFYECLPVPGYGKVVVNDKSATWPPHYQKGIQADHMNITKFASIEARGYRDFIGEVGRWLDEDTGERRQRSDILNKLDFAERTARQQQIDNADALELTLDWIWSKDHENHSSFAQWLLDDEAVFWIQGKPGSGKSTLMSYIEKASQSWQRYSGSDTPWSTIRFFFDFRAHSGLANNLEGFLRSLLFQILKQSSTLQDELRLLKEKYDNSKAETWASSALKVDFVHALLQVSTNLCILADGLDEFSGSMHELLAFFHKLPSRTTTGHLVKICLASRPQPVISLALEGRPGLQMQAHNSNAIEQYAVTTMANLGLAAYDSSLIEQFSADITSKAEGVFLWARFAVMEVVNGCAEGEDVVELHERLKALPSDMEQLYAHIFKDMSSRDREEAQLMFQLVCFAQEFNQGTTRVRFINLRQLKEAIAISQNKIAEPAQLNSVDGLERFRRRLKAKSGGLLEEIFHETNYENHPHSTSGPNYVSNSIDRESIYATRQRAHNNYKENGGKIKLIHRTAESYLDRKGWFLPLKSLQLTSPHALWLHVCCKSIQSKLGPQESQLRHAQPRKLQLDESTKSSLFGYASCNLFVHARLFEFRSQESSLPFLAIVSPPLWRYLRNQFRSRLFWEYNGSPSVDWDAVDEGSDRQPWQIIVEQGLPLCLRDAALRHYYTPPSDGEDISLNLSHAGMLRECDMIQLISYLVNLGAVVRQRHIIECLHWRRADILGFLLNSWPEGKIRLQRDSLYQPKSLWDGRAGEARENYTYNGESVGILWELSRVGYMGKKDCEAMLILLLERGESLNEVCGPGGTALHGSIIQKDLSPSLDIGLVKIILDNGADPNVSGPRGTPLQLAWRMFRSKSNFDRMSPDSLNPLTLSNVMRLLLDFGADPSWVEPNGISIDRRTIEAWCAMSEEETEARWNDDDYPYCKSNWYTYEFPLYRSAQNLRPDKRIRSHTERHTFNDPSPPERPKRRRKA